MFYSTLYHECLVHCLAGTQLMLNNWTIGPDSRSLGNPFWLSNLWFLISVSSSVKWAGICFLGYPWSFRIPYFQLINCPINLLFYSLARPKEVHLYSFQLKTQSNIAFWWRQHIHRLRFWRWLETIDNFTRKTVLIKCLWNEWRSHSRSLGYQLFLVGTLAVKWR